MKKRRRISRKKGERSGPIFMKHPFSDIDPDALKAMLVEIAKKKTIEFPEAIERLFEFLRTYDPFHLLSVLSTYGLMVGVHERDGVMQNSKPLLQQHHVELLQALLLSISPKKIGIKLARPDVVQKIIDLLDDVADAFHQRRYAAMEAERDSQNRILLAIQEQVRAHTQMVRNWGYFPHVISISLDLYSPLDEPLRRAHGFSATELITVARHLVSLLEARMTERLQALRRIFRERKGWDAIRTYYKVFPDLKGEPEDLRGFFGSRPPLSAVRAMILEHSDLRLPEYATFTAAELEERTGISGEVILKIINVLSFEIGALVGKDIEHFFMGNPIWRAPIIKMEKGFYCCIPQSIFSHIHYLMRYLCDAAGLKTVLEERRSEYLEKAVHSLLKKALPEAELMLSVRWKVGSEQYENDHLAFIDRTLLIVEDKSAALTESGLRGAPDRIKRHIKDLIIDPSDQSLRLEKLIWAAKDGDTDAVESLKPIGLPLVDIDRIIRLSVTIDDFSVLSSAEREIREVGLLPDGIPLAPVMAIADLGVVVEITSRPFFFLHYLSERYRIQKNIKIVAGEVDFLGLYLETGFNIGQMERDKVDLIITGMLQPIDNYYDSLAAGVKIPKPEPKIGAYFKRIFDGLALRKPSGWLSWTSYLLSSASYREQKKLDRMLNDLRDNVKKHWRNPSHKFALGCFPPEGRDTAIVYVVLPPQLYDKRKELVGDVVQNMMSQHSQTQCLVIGRNTERWDDPYAWIGMVNLIDR